MTPEQAKLNLHVIQAYSERKPIQVRPKPDGKWEDYTGWCPAFHNDNLEWRVKPDPEEFWIIKRRCYIVPADAYHHPPEGYHEDELIHVRQVVKPSS